MDVPDKLRHSQSEVQLWKHLAHRQNHYRVADAVMNPIADSLMDAKVSMPGLIPIIPASDPTGNAWKAQPAGAGG